MPCTAVEAPPDQRASWEQIENDGITARDANKYWIAEPLLKEAVVKAGAFGMSDIRLAKSFGELGRLYAVRGLFTEAEPYLEEELDVKRKALSMKNAEIVPAMGSLIEFYLMHGTAAKADPLAKEMLSIVEGKIDEKHAEGPSKITMKKGQPLEGWAGTAAPTARDPLLDWAISCDKVGNRYRDAGNLDMAERMFQAALDVKEMILGKQHLSLANSYDSLGSINLDRDDYKEAIAYYRDALAQTERILPPEDPQVYVRLDKLAKTLIKAGKLKEAEDLYIRAQSFWKTEPSKNGEECRAMFALGSLYVQEKRYAEAAPILQKALKLSEEINGPSSVSVVPYLQRYAYDLYYLGRKPEVEQLHERTNTISGGTL